MMVIEWISIVMVVPQELVGLFHGKPRLEMDDLVYNHLYGKSYSNSHFNIKMHFDITSLTVYYG